MQRIAGGTLRAARVAACTTHVSASRCALRRSYRFMHSAAAVSSADAQATPAQAVSASAAPVAASANEEPRAAPKPHKPALYTRKPALHPDCTRVPPPARPTTEAEFEALKLKGYDGTTYDMLACYQLGQLLFDGIPAPKIAASAAAPSLTSSPADPLEAAPFEEAPWSLPKNYSQSLLWFTNAAFEGHVPARTKLGVMYLAGYGIKRMVDIALQLFGEAAALGDRDAMAHLAAMHLQGVGTPKDAVQAVHFFTQAAERQHVRAQAALATLLDSPTSGTIRDPAKARYWLSAAAAQQHTESQFLLAQRLQAEGNTDGAFRWHFQAARGGHAEAQYLVGLAYLNDAVSPAAAAAVDAPAPSSLDARLRAAARWFSSACEQGNVGAQARMGFLCLHGVGTQQDEAAALMWLSNAAEASQASAQLQLGSIACASYEKDAPTSGSGAAASPEVAKKLQTAKAYFDKVLENAHKQCTTLPSGSLPLLVRMTQEPSLAGRCIQQFRDTTGHPWLGDMHALLQHTIHAEKQAAEDKQSTAAAGSETRAA